MRHPQNGPGVVLCLFMVCMRVVESSSRRSRLSRPSREYTFYIEAETVEAPRRLQYPTRVSVELKEPETLGLVAIVIPLKLNGMLKAVWTCRAIKRKRNKWLF